MTREDTAKIISMFIYNYPMYYRQYYGDSLVGLINMWNKFFEDGDYAEVEHAVNIYISTNKWPPTIADINNIIIDVNHPELIKPNEAWKAVNKLLLTCQFGECPLAEGTLVKEAVDSVGWYNLRKMDASYQRAAFMDAYKEVYDRERQRLMIRPEDQKLIDQKKENCKERECLEVAQNMEKRLENIYMQYAEMSMIDDTDVTTLDDDKTNTLGIIKVGD